MPTNAERAYEVLKDTIGTDEGAGDWFTVTQDVINKFADVTIDHQWIHVDPERCAEMSPWKTPIAHGFLTLSMLSHLNSSQQRQLPPLDGILMGVNYGFDKVRFITPVKVSSRIRVHSSVSDVKLKDPNSVLQTRTMTIEIEGEPKPAVVAEWLTLISFA